MKTKISLSIILLCSVFFTSCNSNKPLVVAPSDNNKTFKIDYLFEHDGCKVYRFSDKGNYVYFSNCRGSITAISNDSIAKRTTTITDIE